MVQDKIPTGGIVGPGHIIYAFSKCHFLTHLVFKDLLVFSPWYRARTWPKRRTEQSPFIGGVEICLLIVVSDLGLGQEQSFQIFKVFWHVDPWDVSAFVSDIAERQ